MKTGIDGQSGSVIDAWAGIDTDGLLQKRIRMEWTERSHHRHEQFHASLVGS